MFCAAAVAFTETGRGAVVVDTTAEIVPDKGHPFAYFPQDLIGERPKELNPDQGNGKQVTLVSLDAEAGLP